MSTFSTYQLRLSGLHLLAPNWQDNSKVLPLMPHSDDGLYDHTIVVWIDSNSSNNVTCVAAIGGWDGSTTTASVIFLNDIFSLPKKQEWLNGPRLNESRRCIGASVCNRNVYVMGGRNNEDDALDTIERISVSDLFYGNRDKNIAVWTKVLARLSTRRDGCAAVTVHNRFIVVMGGWNDDNDPNTLASVDIIDTMPQAASQVNNSPNHEEQLTAVTVSKGPTMKIPRYDMGAAVLDDRIWIVGGMNGIVCCSSVECLQYVPLQNNNEISHSVFTSGWTIRPDLSLEDARHGHSVAAMGQCLVVAGGFDSEACLLESVELLDPYRGVVLQLPDLDAGQHPCTMVATGNEGLVEIGGDDEVFVESLPFVNLSLKKLKKGSQDIEQRQQSVCFCRGSPISETEHGAASQEQLRHSQLERMSNSLVFFYLFYKDGHIPCVQQHKLQLGKVSF